jgi:hypothetical protein
LRYIDKNGFYEEDVHRSLTFVLAFAAGFSRTEAYQISNATQAVDDNLQTSPLFWPSTRKAYHFTTGERRDELFSTAVRTGSLSDLGIFLHAEQDSYSHAGFGPWLGQGLNTSWDKTYDNPDKALRMSADTYDKLVWFREARGNGTIAVPFSAIQGLVTDFARARTNADKTKALQAIVEFIERVQQAQKKEQTPPAPKSTCPGNNCAK